MQRVSSRSSRIFSRAGIISFRVYKQNFFIPFSLHDIFETSTMEKFLIYNIYKLSMKSNALWRFWTFGKIPFPASAHA